MRTILHDKEFGDDEDDMKTATMVIVITNALAVPFAAFSQTL